MPRKNCSKFNFAHRRETLLALAISAALAPASAWALNLQEAPPQVVPPYVAPNVIISLDDTGSMGSTDMKDPVSGAYISRLTALKNAVKSVFQDKDLLPDGKIRLAWQSIWIGTYGGSEALKKAGSFGPNQLNSMAPLEGAHRTDFIAFINALATSGNTSLHKLVSQADGYMRGSLNTNSPWASKDASGKTVYLGCRRNYHILMTDGRWNNAQSTPSNSDDSIFSFAAPDGSTKAFPAPVGAGRNVYTDSSAGTLADWAFYSWAKPLQNATDLTGKPQVDPAYTAAPATSTFGAASMDKFWDPRYDPATWPHMVTYTIGFSSDATTWSNTATGGPAMTAPSQNVPYSYDGSFPDLVTGTKNWPSMGGVGDETVHALDLWHASVNGRGRFYAVNSAADLEAAFRQIIGTINADNQPVTGNGTTSGSNSSRVDVGRYLTAYQSAEHWKGYVQAFKITSSTSGTTVTDIKTPLWTTSNKLDARSPDSRVILTWDDALAQGKNFDWTLLNATERAALNQNYSTSPAGTDTLGKDRVAYIRGDRSKEGSGTATAPFRVRASAQGDIVNSILWYTDSVPASGYALKDYSTFAQDQITLKRPSMLYVGGNDGMLHGFRAYGLNADGSPDYDTGGDELFAYVPHGVIDNLAKLTGQSYDQKHAYFVDGSPMTGDADLGENGTADGVSHTTDWSTVLVGTLGLGGKGYFVLDVTDPTSFTNSKVLTDRTRSGSDPKQDCTKLPTGAAKTTCEEKADIGYITAAPAFDQANQAKAAQIVRMNNNRWAVVLGNGYNSESHDAVLLIQYLDGDKKLKRILAPRANYINNKSSCSGSGTDNCDNGLSTPRLVDLDSDGRPDVAYAGDNYGHMWKFDLTSGNDAEWTTAFGGRPLFAANGPSSNKVGDDTNRNVPQAITAPPLVRANDLGIRALMVAFGTGRNVDTCDPFVIVTGGGAGVGGSPGVCSSTTANAVQTLYSILDRTTYSYRTPLGGTTSTRLQVNNIHESPVSIGNSKYAGGSPDKLNQRTIQSIGTSGGVDYFTITGAGANFSGTCSGSSCEEGWFMDLGTDGTAGTGERVLKALQFYQGTNIIAMYSGTPAKGSNNAGGESCDSSSGTDETQFLTFLNIMNGNTSSFGILDMNGDGKFDTGVASPDKNATRISTPPGDNTLMSTTGANGKEDHCNFDSNNKCTKLAPVPEVSMRPNWRQIE